MYIRYYGRVMKYAISALALAVFLVPASALAVCNGVGNSCAYNYDYAAAYTQPYTRTSSQTPYSSYGGGYQQPQQYSPYGGYGGYGGYQQPSYGYGQGYGQQYGGGYGQGYGNNYGGYGQGSYQYSGYGQQQPIYFPVYNTYIPNLTPNYGGGYGGYGCGSYSCY